MKVLHIGNFGYRSHGESFYNIDRKLSAGFTRNGHFVYEFSLRDMARMSNIFKTKKLGKRWAGAEILRICEKLEPELVLLGHAQMLMGDTLKQIKLRWPNTKIVLWYVDALFYEDKTQYMYDFEPYLDAVFATTGGEYLQRLLPNTVRAFIPNIVDSSVESLKNFEKRTFNHELIFCGSIGDDIQRKQFLEEVQSGLSDLPLSLNGIFGHPIIKGMDYIRAVGKARMGLNYSRRNDVCLYSSDRIAQLTGHGLLTFTPRIPEFDLIYKDDEVRYFDTTAELVEMTRYYANHPDEAAQIAEAGWKRAHESCSTERVTRFMEEVIFNRPYSELYEWLPHVFKAK